MVIFNPADTFLIGTKLAKLMLIFKSTTDQASGTVTWVPVGDVGNYG